MKKIIVTLSLIALIGAGCAKAPVATEKTSDTTPLAETSNMVVTTTNPDGSTTETSVSQKTQTTKSTEKDEDGVPIIDITLGSENSIRTIDIKSGNFFFEPKVINAKPGEKLRIDFRGNVGTHTFVIDEAKVKETVKDGSGFEFIVPTTPGSYAFYCDVGNHRAMGMKGMLIVK